jgi:hypothetical protein
VDKWNDDRAVDGSLRVVDVNAEMRRKGRPLGVRVEQHHDGISQLDFDMPAVVQSAPRFTGYTLRTKPRGTATVTRARFAFVRGSHVKSLIVILWSATTFW